MASALRSRLTGLLSTVQKTVEPSAKYLGTEVSTRYDKLMKDNAQYVVKDKAAADKLLKQWVFTRLARYSLSFLFSWKELCTTESGLTKICVCEVSSVGICTVVLYQGDGLASTCE
jgi:hypothetical protein